jgi:hypothetical protein
MKIRDGFLTALCALMIGAGAVAAEDVSIQSSTSVQVSDGSPPQVSSQTVVTHDGQVSGQETAVPLAAAPQQWTADNQVQPMAAQQWTAEDRVQPQAAQQWTAAPSAPVMFTDGSWVWKGTGSPFVEGFPFNDAPEFQQFLRQQGAMTMWSSWNTEPFPSWEFQARP